MKLIAFFKEFKDLPKISRKILCISLIIAGVSIIPFIFIFYKNGISSNISDWAHFGAFFMIPLSILSLGFNGAILIWLNESVLNNNRAAVQEQILAQQRVVIIQLRYKAYEEIFSFLDSKIRELASSTNSKALTNEILSDWKLIFSKHRRLFKTVEIFRQSVILQNLLENWVEVKYGRKPNSDWMKALRNEKKILNDLMWQHSVYGELETEKKPVL